MKISKVFTGLVVCGALIFPGALSSSAQEIDSSESPESVEYSIQQETKSLTVSEKQLIMNDPYMDTSGWFGYRGSSFTYSYSIPRPAPYAPANYSGLVLINYDKSNPATNQYYYAGRVYLQNPL